MSHRSNGCGKKGSSKGSSREPAKKSEFFEKFEQIEREFTAIEKECNGVLFCHKSEFRKEHCVLEEIQIKADNDRKSERQNLRQQLGKIRSNVDKFQRELMDVKASPAFVQKLKEMMEDIEESIMHFKDQQREYYDTLLQDERTLIKELAATEKKFESWSPLPPPITTAVGAKKGAVSASLPPAVAAFERFLLQTGGHQGGWDDYDHNMFLKLKAQHKTRDAFLNAAEVSIPGQNLSDLRQHLDWYTEYLSLKESKKLAIQEWKHEKQAEKQDGVNKTETEVEEEEARRQKREELFEKERAERLARLGDYKAQRKLDKAKREEARLKEEMQKAKEKEKAERRRDYQRCNNLWNPNSSGNHLYCQPSRSALIHTFVYDCKLDNNL
ncbi:predicted protein [Nematostella vectensis]|uniref:Coiled-coil domain-containing protein 112 n=1 Tax=Nematostella vectensis TaxID=45351 RepID=A7SI52_NEMVE|nr:predicted protein [Nematostella vectensis]|eukprot:XP_001628682.1 predicted protein [Nematostella vectensis]